MILVFFFFFFSSRRRHTRCSRDWSSDVCSSDLEHMDVLGDTREAIAAEKLAVVQAGCVVVLGDPEWAALAYANGAREVAFAGSSNLALAVVAAESFLGAEVDPHAAQDVS